jgi:hypothetical protein
MTQRNQPQSKKFNHGLQDFTDGKHTSSYPCDLGNPWLNFFGLRPAHRKEKGKKMGARI